MRTIKERRKEGKAYRKTTSRRQLGLWEVETDRQAVRELLLGQEETRQPELIPIRRERMAVSPFTFFRGSAVIQAHDLSIMPGTAFFVQACGDAHIANFGIFASPERRLVFDINDFDETLPAPFELDMKRLAVSIAICGRNRTFSEEQCREAVFNAAAMYRKTMLECSEMGNLEVWYRHLDIEKYMQDNPISQDDRTAPGIDRILSKALSKNSDLAIKKLTETVDGKLRIRSDPPLIVPIRDMIAEEKALYDFNYNLRSAVSLYRETLPDDRRILLDQYEPIELAHKVVGVGSVGRRAWILVMMGRENGDPLVMQIKEAEKSVLEDYYGKSVYAQSGQRVVEGQRAIQTAGDIMLGWLRLKDLNGRMSDYYVRQLWDSKGSVNLDKISLEGFSELSVMCAWTLAAAHAKTGDRHVIAGYLGKGEAFEHAMTEYAASYADQNEADYETFLQFLKEDC